VAVKVAVDMDKDEALEAIEFGTTVHKRKLDLQEELSKMM
jgi:hypothetical protein